MSTKIIQPKPKVILLDIEGTTTAITFVTEILFPYARSNLRSFLSNNYNDIEVAKRIKEIKATSNTNIHMSKETEIDFVCDIIYKWMDKNAKIKPLKYLQGLIWKKGYANGKLKGHIYKDAYECIVNKWTKDNVKIYIYSSGSVGAQKLLFGYSQYGNLNPYISGNFDLTNIGDKKKTDSYTKIHGKIQTDLNKTIDISSILFLSDNPLELIASKQAGMTVIQSIRKDVTVDDRFHKIYNFHQLVWSPLSKL
eukprot:225032_1